MTAKSSAVVQHALKQCPGSLPVLQCLTFNPISTLLCTKLTILIHGVQGEMRGNFGTMFSAVLVHLSHFEARGSGVHLDHV